MPVVFAQPEPMAPEIQAGGGAAEIATKDFPTLASMYESNQRNALAASTAQAQISASAQAAHAQAFNQATAYAQQAGQQAQQFRASQVPSERDTYLASVQAASAQQHAQLQAWLSSQELSQAEGIRLQRMQNAVGAVQANPDLDDETKTNLISQLQTGIDPLKQRQENAKAKLENEQMAQAHNNMAQQEAWKVQGDAFAAKNAPDGVLYVDSNGNVVDKDYAGPKEVLMRNHQGEWKAVNSTKPPTAAKEQPEKAPVNEQGMTSAEYGKFWNEIHKEVVARAKDHPGLDIAGTIRETLQAGNWPTEWKAADQRPHQGRTPPPTTPPIGGLNSPPQQTPPNTPPAAVIPQKQDLAPKPWPADEKQWTPEMRARQDVFQRMFRAVDDILGLDGDQKRAAQSAIGEMAQMTRKFGDVTRMDAEQRTKFAKLAKEAEANLPAKGPPPPAPPPPQVSLSGPIPPSRMTGAGW